MTAVLFPQNYKRTDKCNLVERHFVNHATSNVSVSRVLEKLRLKGVEVLETPKGSKLTLVRFAENFSSAYRKNANLLAPVLSDLEKKLEMKVFFVPDRKLHPKIDGKKTKNERIAKKRRACDKILNDLVFPARVVGRMTHFYKNEFVVNRVQVDKESVDEDLKKKLKTFEPLAKRLLKKKNWVIEYV